jgi:hypothetical protein
MPLRAHDKQPLVYHNGNLETTPCPSKLITASRGIRKTDDSLALAGQGVRGKEQKKCVICLTNMDHES